jgi:pyruvate dehydrogenase E2 component (dihydrolipoamide acetyltransferase)
MAREFRLPDLGSGLKEGRVLRWCVAVGDEVTTDGVLCELETEKAVIEVPIPFDGTVLSLAVEEEGTIEVGEVLCVIGGADEPAAAPAPVATTEVPAVESAAAAPAAPQSNVSAATPPAPATGERVRAMPSIRRLAREHGIDLSTVVGTGARGRITRSDVEAAIAGAPPSAPPSTPAAARADRREKLSMLRKSIAEHMTRSWQEIPHVFTRMEVDASRLLEARTVLTERLERKVPLEALLIKATIPALQEFPEFNAGIEGDEIILYGRYDVGVAVDTFDGLIVPVIRSADTLTFAELVDGLLSLYERTMNRRAAPDELTGNTFTVNNIGAGGHLMGTSIIPHRTTAILSVGRAEKKPVVRNDQIEIRPVMEVSLCFDHRAIDGGGSQRFMARIRENLEQPIRFLAV